MSLTFPNFLTSPALLLQADGELAELPIRAFLPGQPLIVIARELCGFAHFRAPGSLGGGAQLRAARLQASLIGPYADTGTLITRSRADFGIWWWNAAWVKERLSAAGLPESTRLLPETMVRPAGNGWRLVRASSGFELQVWEADFLLGDVWSRRPLTDEDWDRAVHSLVSVASEPEARLGEQELPFTLSSPYLKSRVGDVSFEQLAPTAIAAFVMLIVCMTGYWTGQGFRLLGETQRLQKVAEAVDSSGYEAQRRRLLADYNAIQQVATATAGSDPLESLLDVERKLKPFGLKVLAFDVTRDRVKVTLPNEAGVGLDLISDQLQSSGEFFNLSPKRDPAKQEVTLEMQVRHPA
jgi:hypothetical protein